MSGPRFAAMSDPDAVALVEVVVAEARAQLVDDLLRDAHFVGGDVHLHLPRVFRAGDDRRHGAVPPMIDFASSTRGITSSSRFGVREFWRTSSTANGESGRNFPLSSPDASGTRAMMP